MIENDDYVSNPEFLDGEESFTSENLERTPDRRSWERTSKVIENFSELDEQLQSMVSGIVGNRAAASFFEYVNQHKLPSVSKMLGEGKLSENSKLLEALSFTEFTQLNEAIFRWRKMLRVLRMLRIQKRQFLKI